jgi:hypothetical protein
MPALISTFYQNGNVVEYVREKLDEAKLDMVSIFCSLRSSEFWLMELSTDETNCQRIELPS